MNIKYNILRPRQRVFDLGCSPGGWSQVAVELTKSKEKRERVFGIDLLSTEKVPGALFLEGDITNEEHISELRLLANMKKADVLVSDIAPNFVGSLEVDFLSISELNLNCVSLAQKLLKPGGNFVMKTLNGGDEANYFVRNSRFRLKTEFDFFDFFRIFTKISL